MASGSAQKLLGFVRPSQLLWKFSDAARQFRERRILNPQAALGKRGEDLAHRYLQRAGYRVIARNYMPKEGEPEIDIVARQGDITVFVEVKSRMSAEFGDPERAIGAHKRGQIVRAARRYCASAGIEWSQVRFDTISIVFTSPPSLVHQQDAFFDGRAI